ncbi:unnamed protein product [Urochloa decumbens]|uniref:NAC domain-containing protein n=1 Tax=Urochloa decumbens TaxID=240449 RepID=A0ABC8XZB0_9POAL
MADGSLTKHGFPRGYRFVPTPLELLSLLSIRVHGNPLRPPHDSIFHDIPILGYHPEELYERYKDNAEHRYIYFISEREFQKAGAGVAVPEDKDQKEPRPVRVARGGGWKPSGGGQVLRLPRKRGGFVAGKMVTMVFYDRVAGSDPVKSNWGMHEFTIPVDEKLTSTPNKYTRFHDLALYRLYILKSGDMESENAAGSSCQVMPNAYERFPASPAVGPPCPPLQPMGMIFTGNQPLAAGASTSKMPPPLQPLGNFTGKQPLAAGAAAAKMPPPQQQLPSAQHAQYYGHHQHAFVGAAAAGASTSKMPHQQKQLPSAQHSQHYHHQNPLGAAQYYHNQSSFGAAAAGAQKMAHNIPVGGAGLPSNMRQSASSPSPVPVPPAVMNPAAAHHAPAPAAHGGAKQEVCPFGATCSPPAIESPPAATTPEPAHAQFADCLNKLTEEVAAKDERMADADDFDGLGTLPDWNNLDLDFMPMDDDSFQFTMDEILGFPGYDEPPAMEGDNNNAAGENCGQAGGSAAQQDPPAALSCY